MRLAGLSSVICFVRYFLVIKLLYLLCYLLSSKLISSKLMLTAGEPIKNNVIVPNVHFIFST